MFLNIYPLFPASKEFSPVYSPLRNQPLVDLWCGQCLFIRFWCSMHFSRVWLLNLLLIYIWWLFDWKYISIEPIWFCNENLCNHKEILNFSWELKSLQEYATKPTALNAKLNLQQCPWMLLNLAKIFQNQPLPD